MRVLIDSNILIYREDNHVILDNIQRLVRILNSINDLKVLVHPLTLEDIRNDENRVRQRIICSKIQTYPSLEPYPSPESDNKFLEKFGKFVKKNDKIDICILYAIYRDAVDFLITEDRGIHKKAKKLGLDERVLLIDDAIDLFERHMQKWEPLSPPALKDDLVFNLSLDDSIFSELKKEYPKFPEWFKKIKREGRKCWVHYKDDKTIGALLIYKIEESPIPSIPPLPTKKRLKLCTFKVTYQGYKIGELFIKLSIDYCVKNDISEIYLTHYTKKEDQLVDLISEYGFLEEAKMPDGEDVFIKNLLLDEKSLDSLPHEQIDVRYYPNLYDGLKVKKFMLPIYPKFHSRFFIDFLPRQLTLEESCGSFIVEGNAIKKAYISQSRIKRVNKGDIILFYCIRPIKKLTSVGVVEAVHPGIKDSDQIMKLVAKRTVYSSKEIDEMKKPVLIILFRHHFHLKKPLTLKELKDAGILLKAPQSIRQITHENYIWIKEKGEIDGRFTLN